MSHLSFSILKYSRPHRSRLRRIACMRALTTWLYRSTIPGGLRMFQ